MLKVAIHSFSYGLNDLLTDISFRLEKGQHMAVLGESGCGKSTLLHLIYGLLHLENGSLMWDDKQLLGPKFNLVPGESFIKLVAQEYNVMPYTTVAENVAEHLGRENKEKDAERVNELLKVVGLEAFPDTKVKYLSGGQKQRVALAKALANAPELLLLDEPFSNIDTFRKNKLRRKLYAYLKTKNIACITATHDSEEALAFSDAVLILKNGRIDAYGSPESVYKNVQSEYQAGFFGEVNRVPLSALSDKPSKEVILLFPHQLKVSESETALQVVVTKSYFKGSNYLVASFWNEREIYFEHKNAIFEGKTVFLEPN